MDQNEKKQNPFVGYEYKEIMVNSSQASMYLDCFENFGWTAEKNSPGGTSSGSVIRMKRDRKLINRMELTRLQRHFNSCVSAILSLESSKYIRASVVAYTVGMIGTAFMAGSVFSITANMMSSTQFVNRQTRCCPFDILSSSFYTIQKRLERNRKTDGRGGR